MAFTGNAHTHNNGTVSLTFTTIKQKVYRKTQYEAKKTQKWPKPKIAQTRHWNYAYVRAMAVLIIFPVILQRVINLIMLSIGEQRALTSVHIRK